MILDSINLLSVGSQVHLNITEKHNGEKETGNAGRFPATSSKYCTLQESGRTGQADLTKKNNMLNYLGDYREEEAVLAPDALWEIIVKSRSHIGAKPSPALKANILAKHESHRTTIEDVKEDLKHTNDQIDQIVYRLYSLTEDEIAVIEKKG